MAEYDILTIIFSTFISGYLAGFMTVKTNHILVIALGKIWTSGNGQQRYIPVGAAISAVYLGLLISVVKDFEFHFYLLLFLAFVGLYVAGVKHSTKRFGDSIEIMEKIIELTYLLDKNDEKQKQAVSDAQDFSKEILMTMPPSIAEALLLLFFFFDSAFAVFFVNLINGRFTLQRFIDLSKNEQRDYIEAWASNPFLFVAIQAIKGLIGFSYYTGKNTWDGIEYNGKMLRNSYLA